MNKSISANMKARWRDPVARAQMMPSIQKGAQRALEAKGGPIPNDPTYRKLRALLGAREARKAFGLPLPGGVR